MRDALAQLPIPTRLVHAMLLSLALMVAPHASNLHPIVVAFFYIACAWRLFAVRRPVLMPKRWVLFLLMMTALALVLFTTGVFDGRRTGTALLVTMLGLKLLELRARRDIHVTVYLGYFLVFTLFLYDQSLWLAVYLFIGVIALTTILLALNRVNVDLRVQSRHTLVLLSAALPLTLVVFLLFPRLDTPLWAIDTEAAVTGISGNMTIGDIGALTQSGKPAFRVKFFDQAPAANRRYWRGPVLWHTDGRHWSAGTQALHGNSMSLPQARIGYEVTLEPTGAQWLFGLDLVTDVPIGAQLNANHSLIAEQRIDSRYTYRAGSDPMLQIDRLSRHQQRLGLQLPARISPRVSALAERWKTRADGRALQIAQHALDYFREQPFVYTLEPGILGEQPVDEFLFETRRGFCEHYASSFVTLMRLAGVPARIVLGYQGGEHNPHANHWVIRQSDAHAWTEIWVDGVGWQRIDPTAAVAPERIEQSIDPARSRSADRVVFTAGDNSLITGLWRNAVWIADAVDLSWHRWIVGFTAQRQSSLLHQVGLDQLHGFSLAVALIAGSALAMALVYILMHLPRPTRRDPLPALWQRFVSKLSRAGLEHASWQGPDTVCQRAIERFPDASEQLVAINRLYVQLRYGRRHDTRQLGALRQRINGLRLR